MPKKAKPAKQKTGKSGTPTRGKVAENQARNKEALLKALKRTGCNVSAACRSANLDRDTYYTYLEKDEAFAAAVRELEEQLMDEAEDIVRKIMKNPRADVHARLKAAKMRLDARAKDRGYGTERKDLNHKGEIGLKQQVVMVRIPRNGREPN